MLVPITKSVFCGLLLVATQGMMFAQGPTTPTASQIQLTAAIHDYILAHPEVVLQSVRDFDMRNKAADQQKIRDRVKEQKTELALNSPSEEPAAPSPSTVTVVEFFDYRCGYCKKVEDTVVNLSKIPGVRIVYKDLPILGGDSLIAAQAALAADKQGGYAKLHHAMLRLQTSLDATTIDKLSEAAGLDLVRLKKDMASPEVSAAIARNEQLAEKLEVRATPTFVVGDQLVSGALSLQALQALIENARQTPSSAATLPSSNAGTE